MRAKLLKGEQGTMVLLVYPSSAEEYRRAFNILGGSAPVAGKADTDPAPAGSRPARAAYVVTAATEPHLWDLPDLRCSAAASSTRPGDPAARRGPAAGAGGPAGCPLDLLGPAGSRWPVPIETTGVPRFRWPGRGFSKEAPPVDAVSVYRVGADGAEPFCSFGREARDGDLPRAVWLGWLPLSLVDFAGPGIAQVGDAWLTAPSGGSGASRPPFPATPSSSTTPPPSWPRAAADLDVLWTAGGNPCGSGAGCWAAPVPR